MKRAKEYYQHADNLFHHRFNFFLVAESMLIISYATIYVWKQETNPISVAISILGIGFTLGWIYTNARLSERVNYMIKNYMKKYDPIYNEYLTKSVRGLYSSYILAYVLPSLTFLVWGFFILFPFFGIGYQLGFWMAIFFSVILIISSSFLESDNIGFNFSASTPESPITVRNVTVRVTRLL